MSNAELLDRIHEIKDDFNDAQLSIQKQLSEINLKIESICSNCPAKKYVEADIKRLEEMIIGTKNSKGLNTRIALLESLEKRAKWLVTFLISLMGLTIGLLSYAFK